MRGATLGPKVPLKCEVSILVAVSVRLQGCWPFCPLSRSQASSRDPRRYCQLELWGPAFQEPTLGTRAGAEGGRSGNWLQRGCEAWGGGNPVQPSTWNPTPSGALRTRRTWNICYTPGADMSLVDWGRGRGGLEEELRGRAGGRGWAALGGMGG